MDYTKLGRTGLDISRICLGCMTYGVPERGAHPWTLPEDESRQLIRHAVEAGINFFDTANSYSDGTSEEVYGFDIPVSAVDADFDLAILGTKGKWYDHVVSVRDAVEKAAEAETPADGTYTCDVTLEGGSGRATVESPAALTVADGKMTATIVWSSPNYDYMIVDGEKYLPTNTEGNSTFEIPVSALDTALDVTADTVAMSTPHEIEYTLTFDSASLK